MDRSQLKDAFFLQRTLLLNKHAKELEQIKKFNAAKLEECVRAMGVERKRLPKVLRSEAKTRSLMFKVGTFKSTPMNVISRLSVDVN